MDTRIKWLRVAIGANVIVLLIGSDNPLVGLLLPRLGAMGGLSGRTLEWGLLLWPYALATFLVVVALSLRTAPDSMGPGTRGGTWLGSWGRRGAGGSAHAPSGVHALDA